MTPDNPATPPSATTDGIRIAVEAQFERERSTPDQHEYIFSYQVTISNEGPDAAQLQTRHWVIAHAGGGIEEVRGAGVVGAQPRLLPGQSHRYKSFCILKTPRGSMHGSYGMSRDDGERFDAQIPAFALVAPGQKAEQFLN